MHGCMLMHMYIHIHGQNSPADFGHDFSPQPNPFAARQVLLITWQILLDTLILRLSLKNYQHCRKHWHCNVWHYSPGMLVASVLYLVTFLCKLRYLSCVPYFEIIFSVIFSFKLFSNYALCVSGLLGLNLLIKGCWLRPCGTRMKWYSPL